MTAMLLPSALCSSPSSTASSNDSVSSISYRSNRMRRRTASQPVKWSIPLLIVGPWLESSLNTRMCQYMT
jgi:di/tricarboxylate transporter